MGKQNTQSFTEGTVSVGGVMSGTQGNVSEGASPLQQYVTGLQQANMTASQVGGGAGLSAEQAAEIMRVKMGARSTYQLPGENKTGFYGADGHPGFDFNMATAHGNVMSMGEGEVVAVGYDPNHKGYGLRAMVRSGDKVVAYSHLHNADVKVGDKVALGTVIGQQGGGMDDPVEKRGMSTGPHVDISVYDNTGQAGWDATRNQVARQDVQSYAEAGLLGSPNIPKNRQLDQNLQALQEGQEFRTLDAGISGLGNRVQQLKAKYTAGQLTKPQLHQGPQRPGGRGLYQGQPRQ